MKVSFIGSGNVASHLAMACKNANLTVVDICSVNIEHAKDLANKCDARAINSVHQLNKNIDLLIISVNDDALTEIAHQLKNTNIPVVHTAGSVNAKVLVEVANDYGVLYPLQTFSKSKTVELTNVPFFVEASTKQFESNLARLVEKLGAKFQVANSEQRLHLHIAAVFACNFSNYMYTVAKELTDQHKLPFDALKPLIIETAEKIASLSPSEAQTGPAKRHDVNTLQKHLQALSYKPNYYELYKLISEEIQKNQNS